MRLSNISNIDRIKFVISCSATLVGSSKYIVIGEPLQNIDMGNDNDNKSPIEQRSLRIFHFHNIEELDILINHNLFSSYRTMLIRKLQLGVMTETAAAISC